MMQFPELELALQKHFEELVTNYGRAFETNVNKDELWSTYLESIPAHRNPVYRVRREFDCSCCRHFIKNIGSIVFLDNEQNKHTLWGFQIDDPDFQTVLDTMDTYVKNLKITDIYISRFKSVGTQTTRDVEDGKVVRWDHFYLNLPDSFVQKNVDRIERDRADYRDTAQVFNRSLAEISMDAIETVLDLINSNTLYKGAEWKTAIEQLRDHKEKYDTIPLERRMAWVWKQSQAVGPVVGRIRNHSIGVLLTDITNGVDLNEAVTRYERIVAPTNYKRPKAIFTAKMLEEAKQKIMELGYMESLQRRYATLDDITVNNILFSNRDAAKRIQGDVFDEMLADVKTTPKKFDRAEEISIEKFISDVLPGAREVEAYLDNKLAANMVSLIAPVNKDAPSMFKWGNAFSWAYSGNIADSDIRRNVKAAGGNVSGVLRFSIQWNDTGEYSGNDLDAHCREYDKQGSFKYEIFFGQKNSRYTSGQLDVDIIHPHRGTPAVENITWATKQGMKPGRYNFFVHQYSNRGGRDGFRAEIEFDGQIFRYDYQKELRQNEMVKVASVTLNEDGTFSIHEDLPSTTSSHEIWGLKSMNFAPVSVIMYSPNYWDEQDGIGNKHYMFMLKDCVNPEKPNGFYNEFLKHELVEHKRVFEALGGKMAVESVDDQLSGIGFSSTLRNELVVRVTTGATQRVMKIKF